jgi:hypothetical protein
MHRGVTTRLLGAACASIVGGAAALGQAPAQPPGFADALLGRWDLTVEAPDGDYPSWLEVRLRTESELMGRFVGRVGSVRHVSSVEIDGNRVTFEVPMQYERRDSPLRFEGTLADGALSGTTTDARGARLRWTGRRAPALVRSGPRDWGDPAALFNGRDLTGWRGRAGASTACWRVERGVLIAVPPCVDLISERTFEDFSVLLELRYPQGSNSGIYLRGRYEVQIQDTAGDALDPLRMGGVYGFLAPVLDAARAAGEWQTLEIMLVGRDVTVTLNGTTIIDGQQVPGITGGALDSDEGAPGPLMIQGDHGRIEIRRLEVTPAR